MFPYPSLFGNYRTQTFTEIFPTKALFLAARVTDLCPTTLISDDDLGFIYYLLTARFGNSHIASDSEDYFIMQLFLVISNTAPAMLTQRYVQGELSKLTLDDVVSGSTQIFNHSFNPSTEPSTDTLEELETIDDQNTRKVRRSKLDALLILHDAVDFDIYDQFLSKFKKLFIKIAAPQAPLWYYDTSEED